MLKIGLVSVTYNSREVIDEFLNSILAQTYPNWCLYLIDNASVDSTLRQIATYADARIRVVAEADNIGFAAGSNHGIRLALADGCAGVMLINNDTVVGAEFLRLMVKQFSASDADIFAPKMLYYAPRATIWCAGGEFIPANAWAARHFGEGSKDQGQFDHDFYCDFVPMCCVLIKKTAFSRVGLLDERYFIYSEDADWFYRAKLAGLRLLYCHRPVLYHKVSSLTGGLNSKFAVQIGTRNRVYFIRKHFSGVSCALYLFKYFGGMLISLINGKYSWREFKWRLPAFFRGLSY